MKREELKRNQQIQQQCIFKQMKPRVPEALLVKVLQAKLKENIYRDRGYILDGFPRNYSDCQGIFFKINEEEEEEDKKKQFIKEIVPNRVILLQEDNDSVLLDRIKTKKQEEIEGTHYTKQDMLRRLKKYRTENESSVGDLPLEEFFRENKVETIKLRAFKPNILEDSLAFIGNV